jgi:thiosulfate dehydrogenase [quinone] large subunit
MSDRASTVAVATPVAWNFAAFRERPLRMLGITLVLVLRYLFAVFFLGAGINKITGAWMWSDKLRQVFTARLAEIDPSSLGAAFIEHVGLPFYLPIASVVTIVEFAVAVSLLLGLATRTGGVLAIWLMAMFAVGGYYDASLIPLWLIATLFVVLPTGHWLGLDRRLHRQHPRVIWFR